MAESEHEQSARLAYEAALRALDQQQRELEEVRSRTGMLLAAASISVSLFGSRSLGTHGAPLATVAALAALVAALLLGVVASSRRTDLSFAVSGLSLHARLDKVDDRAEQHRLLASWLDMLSYGNHRAIERIHARFRIAACALAIQIVLCAVALGTTVA